VYDFSSSFGLRFGVLCYKFFFESVLVAGRHTGDIFATRAGPSGNVFAVIDFMLRHLHQAKMEEHGLA
jgi:hypothetical protein